MPSGPAPAAASPGLLDVATGFVAELRAAGLPVSMTESLDGLAALRHVDLARREALRAALAATLVKRAEHRPAFDAVFDVWFSAVPPGAAQAGPRGDGETAAPDDGDLAALVEEALGGGDPALAAAVARLAVDRLAGMGGGRLLGAAWYVHQVWRRLDVDGALARLAGVAGGGDHGRGTEALVHRLADDARREAADRLRAEVEGEVRRRLVEERGPTAVARSLRRPLPEEVDFMHASSEELAALRRTLQPLARRLGVRLARRRRHRRRGAPDFRSTVRHSLSYGGVPAEPRFRHPHPAKPEIVVLADVSGSVAAFARFTLQFVHAISAQFARVRSFAFVDGIDEVTAHFANAGDLAEAVQRVNAEADVVWAAGHSDYGRALTAFTARWAPEITPRTTVVVLGDARNNYHPPAAEALAAVARRARHVWWLNPEPRSYWDTGDSVVSDYAPHCDGVVECRNLRQLEHFVEHLA